jgi:hypothetical protein
MSTYSPERAAEESFRHLGLADVEGRDYEADIHRLAEQVAELEPLRELVTDPLWVALDGLLASREAEATTGLVEAARTHDQFIEWQARVRTLRWLRNLPEDIHAQIADLRRQMASIEAEQREEEEEDHA